MARKVSIGWFPTRLDAETAQGLLTSADIESWVGSDDAGGAYPFDLSGGAHLLVEENDVEAATELLPLSVEGEQRWEEDDDRGGPEGEDRQVGGLPTLEPVEPGAAREEAGGEPRGPDQVHE